MSPDSSVRDGHDPRWMATGSPRLPQHQRGVDRRETSSDAQMRSDLRSNTDRSKSPPLAFQVRDYVFASDAEDHHIYRREVSNFLRPPQMERRESSASESSSSSSNGRLNINDDLSCSFKSTELKPSYRAHFANWAQTVSR